MDINRELQLVLEQFQDGNLKQAEHTCRKILKKQPLNPDALHFLGVISGRNGKHDLAINYIEKALQIDPDYADAYNNLGNMYQEAGQIDKAISCYQKALNLNPDSAQTCYNLGVCLQEKGLYDKAIDCYQKALRLDLNTFGLFNNLGLALQETGHTDEALFYLQKAIETDSTNADAFNNMGMVLQKKEQLDGAINCYQKALQLDPNLAKAYYNMGLALQDKGQLRDAKKCFGKSIELDPRDPSGYVGLGRFFQSEGQRFAPEKSFLAKEWSLNTIGVQVDNENKLLYVVIPKAGSTAIRHKLFFQPLFGKCDYPEIRREINQIITWNYVTTLEPYKDFFKFAVVRDPFTRFMSAFFHLIHKDYRYSRNFHVVESLGIQDWPDEILTDPNKFLQHVDKELLNRDIHTALQTYILPKDLDELDYIGQLENMNDVGRELSRVLGININFDWVMLGDRAPKEDYYSMKIDMDRFNQIFAEDYETLKDFYRPLKK